jgi:hypothetical protein
VAQPFANIALPLPTGDVIVNDGFTVSAGHRLPHYSISATI